MKYPEVKNMLKNKKKKLKKSLLWRVLASVLLVFVVLACSFISVYVVSMNQTVEKEYQNLIETSISNIDKVFSETIDNTRKYCCSLYDSLEGERLRTKDGYAFNHVVLFYSDLSMCFQICPYVQSIYVISMDNKVEMHAINSNCAIYTEPLDNLLVDKLNSIEGKLRPFLWTVKNRYKNQEDVDILSVYYRDTLPSNALYRGATVINIDTRLLSSSLFSNTNENEIFFYILNQDGIVVAHNDRTLCGQDWSQNEMVLKILSNNDLNENVARNGEVYEVFARKSSTEGYYLVAEAQKQGLFRLMDHAFLKSLMIMTIIFVVAAIILFSVCQYIFFPFNTIIRKLKNSNLTKVVEDRDDIAVLCQYHNDVSQYVSRLQQKEIKNTIVKAILSGQNVERAIRSQSVTLADAPYRVVIVHLGDENDQLIPLSDYDR